MARKGPLRRAGDLPHAGLQRLGNLAGAVEQQLAVASQRGAVPLRGEQHGRGLVMAPQMDVEHQRMPVRGAELADAVADVADLALAGIRSLPVGDVEDRGREAVRMGRILHHESVSS